MAYRLALSFASFATPLLLCALCAEKQKHAACARARRCALVRTRAALCYLCTAVRSCVPLHTSRRATLYVAYVHIPCPLFSALFCLLRHEAERFITLAANRPLRLQPLRLSPLRAYRWEDQTGVLIMGTRHIRSRGRAALERVTRA